VLGTDANDGSSAMRAPKEELGERHKVIKFAPVQPRTKQITHEISAHRGSAHVSILETIPAEFSDQSEPSRSVVGEGSGRAVGAEIRKGTARMEIDVIIRSRKFVARHELAGRIARGLCAGKRSGLRRSREAENIAGDVKPADSRRGGLRRRIFCG